MIRGIGRRVLLRSGIALGVGLHVQRHAAFAQDDRASLRPQAGDLLVKAGDSGLKPLTPDDILLGSKQTLAWAMDAADRMVRNGSRLNQILLVRLDATALVAETAARAAAGVVAYTAICTHTGCEVGEWLADEHLLHCPCHFSKFDPKDGARVVDGPAPRTLPALPLVLIEGKLSVAKPFTARVGFETA